MCIATVIRSYPVHTFALFVIQKSLKFGRAFPVLGSFRVLPLPLVARTLGVLEA